MLDVRLQLRRPNFKLDVRFTAPTPGITALFGRSGAGKTTIIQLLAGLLKADSGAIELDGSRLFDSAGKVDMLAEARGVGCVFQDLRLFPHLNVEGNLRYGFNRAGRTDRRIAFDRIVGLLDLATLLQRHTWQLSGDNRRAVRILVSRFGPKDRASQGG